MYPGIGKDLIMIIIGGLGWDLLKDFGRNFEREIMPLLPGLIPSLPPTPPSHYPWPPPAPSSPLRYPPSHYPWRDAGPAPARVDPLVLDLNRDGKVELKNAAYFDLNANGFHEFTRWIDKADAFLVLDKNFNGKADNGSELFGDAMTLPDGSIALTGFDALKSYDSNGDGKIDASDEIYASLKVLTGEGKMSSLADAGVKSLNLASTAVNENTPPALSQSDLAKLTWEERVLALKDQAREADRALWESGGSIALYICASF